MKTAPTQASHVTRGNVLDDLGFSPSQALELKIKSDIWLGLRRQIEKAGHTQRELCRILDEHQPNVSNLLNGRISRMSIEKLLRYTAALDLQATVKIISKRPGVKPRAGKAA